MQQHIPVVTLHQYNAKPQKTDYTSHAINQAEHTGNTVYSITDYGPNTNPNLKNYTHIPLSELITEEYIVFNEEYIHMSTNPFNFERAAIAKFFLLKEFMQKFNYKTIFHIDSDVLLYTNINEAYSKYDKWDFTLCSSQHCASSFFSLSVIEKLCDGILKTYVDRERYFWYRYIVNIYKKMQENGRNGGISDMLFLEHYKNLKECNTLNHTCGEMNEVNNNCTFYFSMKHNKGGYQMKDGIKDIIFKDKIPFCFNEELQKNIQFMSLHFLGNTKEILENYITYNK